MVFLSFFFLSFFYKYPPQFPCYSWSTLGEGAGGPDPGGGGGPGPGLRCVRGPPAHDKLAGPHRPPPTQGIHPPYQSGTGFPKIEIYLKVLLIIIIMNTIKNVDLYP